jgi:hypothetical protein
VLLFKLQLPHVLIVQLLIAGFVILGMQHGALLLPLQHALFVHQDMLSTQLKHVLHAQLTVLMYLQLLHHFKHIALGQLVSITIGAFRNNIQASQVILGKIANGLLQEQAQFVLLVVLTQLSYKLIQHMFTIQQPLLYSLQQWVVFVYHYQETAVKVLPLQLQLQQLQ